MLQSRVPDLMNCLLDGVGTRGSSRDLRFSLKHPRAKESA
jgi:hypothetical protein